MSQLEISVGEYTEDLLQFVLKELGDEHIDEIEVERQTERKDPIASEPITTSVVITLAPMLIIATARIIEKWIEARRQTLNHEMILKGYALSKEAGDAIRKLATVHANVTVQDVPELKTT
jgi:hypothetical protein